MDSTSCAEFDIMLSTLHKVRNVTIIYYTLKEWMAMEVLLHDCYIQHHMLGSTLCALYIRLEIYIYIYIYIYINIYIYNKLCVEWMKGFENSTKTCH